MVEGGGGCEGREANTGIEYGPSVCVVFVRPRHCLHRGYSLLHTKEMGAMQRTIARARAAEEMKRRGDVAASSLSVGKIRRTVVLQRGGSPGPKEEAFPCSVQPRTRGMEIHCHIHRIFFMGEDPLAAAWTSWAVVRREFSQRTAKRQFEEGSGGCLCVYAFFTSTRNDQCMEYL